MTNSNFPMFAHFSPIFWISGFFYSAGRRGSQSLNLFLSVSTDLENPSAFSRMVMVFVLKAEAGAC